MPIAENISERFSYKAYASGVITPGSEPVPATAPGASGAQILRQVNHNLSLNKDTYQSNEKRNDRQIGDFRHGIRRVGGSINGELGCLTYADLFEAVFRGTWGAGLSLSESELTSAAADNATSKFTFGGGDPVAEGLRVGMVARFGSLSVAANNSKNFVITGFSGASNRDVSVYPAPADMSADSTFTLDTAGKSLIIPSASHVQRLFAFESYAVDIDVAQLFTECRLGGFNLNLPATGIADVSFNVLGRNLVPLSGGSAPFFTSPSAATGTGNMQAVNGLLLVDGSSVATVTGLQMSCDLSPNAPPIIGQNLVPEIFLGSAIVRGQFSAFFQDGTLVDSFSNESELQLLLYLTASNDAAAQALSIFLPRIKLGSANQSDDGSGGKIVQFDFQALKYEGSAAGIPNTTIQMVDTEVS